MIEDYTQLRTIIRFHRTPRFGNSNNFADFLSPESNYLRGCIAFGIFLFVLWIVWLLSLLILKYYYGIEKVGWAAGGDIIDVQDIKKNRRHLKPLLRSMVIRSWRVQSTFIMASFFIPFSSWLLIQKGLEPTMSSLDNIHDILTDIDSVLNQGTSVVDALIREQQHIDDQNFDLILDKNNYCPSFAGKNVSISNWVNINVADIIIPDMSGQLSKVITEYEGIVRNTLEVAAKNLDDISGFITSTEETFEFAVANDWQPKMFLLVLNVINLFLIGGYMFIRNNVVHYPYKFLLTWLFVPTFIIQLLIIAIATSVLGIVISMNSDFCSGGEYPGSPQGTIEEMILNKANNNEQGLPYQAFQYYMTDCVTENPLNFASEYEPIIQSAKEQADIFTDRINEYGLEEVTKLCGADIVTVVDGVHRLMESMTRIEGNIQTAQRLSSCSTMTPVLRRILHGPTCHKSVDGLAWMFGSSLMITILCLVMITTRASLYNATIRGPRRKRNKAAEKEFKEYTKYMGKYYDDAHVWKMDHPKPENNKDKCSIEGIPHCDTGVTERSSFSDEQINCDDESSDGSYFSDATDAGKFLSPSRKHSIDEDSYDSDDNEDEKFLSPCSKDSKFVEQAKRKKDLRSSFDVSDDEILPLSPKTPGNSEEQNEYTTNMINEELLQLSPKTPNLNEARSDYEDVLRTVSPGCEKEVPPMTPLIRVFEESEGYDKVSHAPPFESFAKSNLNAPQKQFKSKQRTSQRKQLW